jgi:signal transduction histidine kinase/CheY-like chemotaxis protein
VDDCEITTSAQGTTVVLKKQLPRTSRAVEPADAARIVAALERQGAAEPGDELRRQNQELLGTLDELRRRQIELENLNRELEDTNRGVVALYAELDERADHLRRADELKRRFLSNMSHEFRTPLHSMLALTQLLRDRLDGPLTAGQERQVNYIDRASRELLQLVEDMLDLAKVEAGRIEVHPTEFHITDLFGALRGMLRPLLVNERLSLVIEEPTMTYALFTDEAKTSQILRNLISNALKFTETGEVRVSAELVPARDGAPARVAFRVADTGIGIATEDLERIFEEFVQVDGPLQRKLRGTGLGLPLSRRLAKLLGGDVLVESRIGHGSRFTLELPLIYTAAPAELSLPEFVNDPSRAPVLVVEDDAVDRFLVERQLRGTAFQPCFAANLPEARVLLSRFIPAAIVLDVVLQGVESAWNFMAELHARNLGGIPVIIVSHVEDRAKAATLGAKAYALKPLNPGWLVAELERCTRPPANVREVVR